MLHAILWTNLVEAVVEIVFLLERISDGLQPCELWSQNVIVLRSSGLGCRINYSLPSRDKIKGVSNQHMFVLCTSAIMWTATYSVWYCPGKAVKPSCIANYLGGLSSMIKHWQYIMTGNGDMGVCARQSGIIGDHPLSAPPLCIIVPNTKLHSISTFHRCYLC